MTVQYFPVWVLLVVLPLSYYFGFTPILLSIIYFIASIVSYYLYAKDKKAARNESWRVSEGTLYLSSILFGWPGAIIARHRLRHKTKKIKFRIYFWLTFLINVSFLVWVHMPNTSIKIRAGSEAFDNWVMTQFEENNITMTVLKITKIRKSYF